MVHEQTHLKTRPTHLSSDQQHVLRMQWQQAIDSGLAKRYHEKFELGRIKRSLPAETVQVPIAFNLKTEHNLGELTFKLVSPMITMVGVDPTTGLITPDTELSIASLHHPDDYRAPTLLNGFRMGDINFALDSVDAQRQNDIILRYAS